MLTTRQLWAVVKDDDDYYSDGSPKNAAIKLEVGGKLYELSSYLTIGFKDDEITIILHQEKENEVPHTVS